MKKIFFILGLFISTNCFAATISIAPFISNNDVTIARLETQRTTIQNVINGNIEGGSQNIRAGSITSSDLATAVNIVTFRKEAFNNFTYLGMLPPTSVTLSSTITAGVSYVSGVRVETAATAHTFTASKDTYTYINAGGFFDYQEVANGAAAPATPVNDLLLALVVSSGTAITSVTDLRTTSIQITANSSNFPANFRDWATLSRDTTTTFHFEPGGISIGSSIYTTTSDTSTKTIATGTNWIEGSVPSNTAPRIIYLYGYNNSGTTWDFKFSSADPVYSDTSSNANGILRYYTTGGTTYRAIGWAYVSADAVQVWRFSNLTDPSVTNVVQRFSSVADTIDDTSYGTDLTEADVNMYCSGGRRLQVIMNMSSNGANWLDNGLFAIVNIDGVDILGSEQSMSGGSTIAGGGCLFFITDPITRGIHTIKIRAKVSGSSDLISTKLLKVVEI